MRLHNILYILIPLLILSIEDIKNKEINSITFLIFIFFIFFFIINYFSLIISIIILNIIYLNNNDKIAYADIITMTLLSSLLTISEVSVFFILIGVTSSIYAQIKKTKIIPLIPFITFSFIITYFNLLNFFY